MGEEEERRAGMVTWERLVMLPLMSVRMDCLVSCVLDGIKD